MQKESGLCATELNQSRIEGTHAPQAIVPADPVHFVKETILVGERKWNDILACQFFRGEPLSVEISKLVMRLVRRYDQDEIDGAVH